LKFDEAKIVDVIDGINSLIKLEDPVGKTFFPLSLTRDLSFIELPAR